MRLQKKKICVISPSLKIGGIERALTILSNFFVSQDYQVFFISCLAGERFYELDRNVVVFEPSFKRSKGITNKVAHYFKTAFFIRQKVLEIHPDVILSFGDKFNPLVLSSVFGLSIPVFISDRTSPDFKFSPLVKLAKYLLYPRASGYIAQTEKAATYKRKKFGNRLDIEVIPNAIKPVNVACVPKSNWILFVGRLSYEKGVDRLITAFSLVKNKQDWKLIIAGSGPSQNDLVKLAGTLGIQEHLVFLGKVNDVDALLSKSSIFVLPSRLEGFPNALCEALSAGLPSICFDCIPFEEIVEDSVDALVAKDNDLSDLANKIQTLIEDPDLRERLSSQAIKIKDRLAPVKIGKLYLDFMFKDKHDK